MVALPTGRGRCNIGKFYFYLRRVVAEWIRSLDSSSGVSDQQSVGSSPGRDTCVLKQDT